MLRPHATAAALRVGCCLAGLAIAAVPACNCGFDPLETPLPHMIVQPKAVEINAAPVAQDTRIVIQVSDPSIVSLEDIAYELTGPDGQGEHDPAFRLDDKGEPLTEVFAGQTGEIVVIVRPLVVTNYAATLVITAEEDARPNRVEVPIVIHAVDAGLPDICDYPQKGADSLDIAFNGVGQNSVGRATINMDNCGIRDLIIDDVFLCDDDALAAVEAEGRLPVRADCEGADAAFHIRDIAPQTAIEQGERGGISTELVFRPLDLLEHTTNVVIRSNDPDEDPVIMRASGTGRACPTACIQLVDSPLTNDGQIEPFDTLQLDGGCSTVAEGATTSIETYNWSLLTQPQGSTAEIEFSPNGTNQIVQLPTDLAGNYTVQLSIADTDGVESCVPATYDVHVVPSEDLHIQLVWDHPSADLDLHVLGDGGTPFTHETDCYFSNRHPTPLDSCDNGAPLCSWVDDVAQNPSLDHDDSDGYGPENTNIVHPAPSSHWRVLVHYWNKQTDGDARTTATLRVFVYGQQQMEIQFTFEDDQQMWQAVDITWPQNFGDPAALAQIGQVVPFARPF